MHHHRLIHLQDCTTLTLLSALQYGKASLPDDVNRADSKPLKGPFVLQVLPSPSSSFWRTLKEAEQHYGGLTLIIADLQRDHPWQPRVSQSQVKGVEDSLLQAHVPQPGKNLN